VSSDIIIDFIGIWSICFKKFYLFMKKNCDYESGANCHSVPLQIASLVIGQWRRRFKLSASFSSKADVGLLNI